jgi:serine protease AprX
LHRDFTVEEEGVVKSALVDGYGHGTHVAGIIAGGLPPKLTRGARLRVVHHQASADEGAAEQLVTRDGVEPQRLAGVAPRTRLVSLKALDDTGAGHSSNIIRALRYIREEVNGSGKLLRIHGVNLSVGYEFNARWFACGQSPMCVEVDKLVRSGVVVVVAAGNTGYGRLSAATRQTGAGLTLTINDPGNAELAITVGATHRDMPHTYGVSYFSSKGPTGDGRRKPDLVAPGERITSCAAGQRLIDACPPGGPRDNDCVYVDDSGTSMAAPHVSGAIAAFLSIRREFVGQPERVKQIFLDSATSLQRAPDFQGRGLVDLMRAIQSV